MLTIRKKQIQLLETHLLRKFEQRVLATLARAFPEKYKTEGPEKCRLFLEAAIRKSEKHGITEDKDIEKFALVLFDRGMDFEQAPRMEECREILHDSTLPGDAKVSLIYHEIGFDHAQI